MKKVITYKEIREKQYHWLYDGFLNDHILAFVSPFFTKLFIKYNIVPNKVTGLMILFGVLGAFFYAIPCLYFKIVGIILFMLWYTMDLCDGEVARATQTFSKYGKELDYTAHAIDHPLITISLMLNTYESDALFTVLIGCLGFLDSIFRNFQTFEIVWRLKENEEVKPSAKIKHSLARFIKYIFLNISTYPLFILVFPILLLTCYKVAYIYVVFAIFATLVVDLISVRSWLKRTI